MHLTFHWSNADRTKVNPSEPYSLFGGFIHLAAGLCETLHQNTNRWFPDIT